MARIGFQISASAGVADPAAEMVRLAHQARSFGLDAVWTGQAFGMDALTALAVIGSQVPDISLGVQVVPLWPRHPMVLAAQALTVQAFTGNRLTLGVGLSHKSTVERSWGYRFERPITYLAEQLTVLRAMLHEGVAKFEGVTTTVRTPGSIGITGATAPDLIAGVLGPQALKVAGRLADGVLLTFTGPKSLREHVVPIVSEAAARAGRAAPRIIAAFPICVTADLDEVRADFDRNFSFVGKMPSYQAALQREGVSDPIAVAALGSEAQVTDHIERLIAAGATEVSPFFVGPEADRERTVALLGALAARHRK